MTHRSAPLLLLALLTACAAPPAPEEATLRPVPELLLLGARVAGHAEADAVLIRGARIVAVGSGAELDAAAGPALTRYDARGGLIVPGLHDAHVHLLSAALALDELKVDEARDLTALQALLRDYAAAHPDATWLRGRGFAYDLPGTDGALTRAQIDAVVADRAVVLESYDGHSLWVNGKALELADVGSDTPDPAPGSIVRDAAGAPTGMLLEGAMALVEDAIPAPDHAAKLAAVRRGLAHCRDLGLTAVDTICGDADDVTLYEELAAQGELPLRVTVSVPLGGDLARYAELRRRLDRAGGLLSFGFLKGFVDGVIESKTAYLLEPYAGDTARGTPRIPADRLKELVGAAHAAGFRVALHAIGDAAVRISLDAYEAARRAHPEVAVRHRIEHIEVCHPDDLPRFAALDVVASLQPIHADPGAEPDGGIWSQNLGTARLPLSFPWRDLLRAGATLAFGSDWPVMSASPLWGLAVATTRKSREGLPEGGWNAHQAIDPDAALRAYTVGPAYALGREADLGALEPGALADLTILAPGVDPARPETLWSGTPRAVVVDGALHPLE